MHYECRTYRSRRIFVIAASLAILALLCSCGKATDQGEEKTKESPSGAAASANTEVVLSNEGVAAAKIGLVSVTQRQIGGALKATGAVEANPQQIQQVTPLVSGRVERVNVSIGDRVQSGMLLAVIASPQVAQMRARLYEQETRLAIGERNLQRVQQAENRVGVLQAKARLDESEASLARTRRLVELGAGAGKDLVAAETAYKSAKAEYDFQNNISLNREVQEANAEVEAARASVVHAKDELRAFGAMDSDVDTGSRDTSRIIFLSPSAGIVSERMVNPGSGVEPGKPMFTIADISTLWIMANVSESQIDRLRIGTPADVRTAALGTRVLSGRVSYIDTQLDEETRTAHVRIAVSNPGEVLKLGMFAEISFQTSGTGGKSPKDQEIVVPSEAIQRIGERTIVFSPKDGVAGHYLVRDVEVGGEADGFTRILQGLTPGESIVATGGFTLKSHLLRGELKEE
jgi:cobalt-zinc-cadmium efflux system membrane fusion protein